MVIMAEKSPFILSGTMMAVFQESPSGKNDGILYWASTNARSKYKNRLANGRNKAGRIFDLSNLSDSGHFLRLVESPDDQAACVLSILKLSRSCDAQYFIVLIILYSKFLSDVLYAQTSLCVANPSEYMPNTTLPPLPRLTSLVPIGISFSNYSSSSPRGSTHSWYLFSAGVSQSLILVIDPRDSTSFCKSFVLLIYRILL